MLELLLADARRRGSNVFVPLSEGLSGRLLADEAAARLPTALDAAAALHTLDLGACALGVDALRAVGAALRAGAAMQLRCLELFGNGDEGSRSYP